VWFKKFSEFILFSSIFISLCAVALCIETNILLGLPFNSFSFYCFVFGATLAQYNLHYFAKTVAVTGSQRQAWSQNKKQLHLLLLIAGVIMVLVSFFSFHLKHFLILACLGAISFLYSFPFLPFSNKRKIKDFGFWKIMTITLLWTLVTVWFPVNTMPVADELFLLIFLKRFVFMFVLCLLFDIRDMEVDSKDNINTLAVTLGREKSYFLSCILLIVFIILCVVQYFYLPQLNILIAMVISVIATFITIEVTKKTNSDYIFLAGIDGMMLLQAALIFLFTLKL
jgi:4-hydroxybenzoate polyprenyltransferase